MYVSAASTPSPSPLSMQTLIPAIKLSPWKCPLVYSTGGVFVGNDEKGYRYVIGSANNALDILTQLKSLKSKGGGSKEMIQGFTPASKTELLKALS